MGFYFGLRPRALDPFEFAEQEVPRALWVLFLLAGFALVCMAGAAHHLLVKMLRTGSAMDVGLVFGILSFVPIYLFTGVRLFFIRKFVAFEPDAVRLGFRFWRWCMLHRSIARARIREVKLTNHAPTPNCARFQHDDDQYFLRGHWRLGIVSDQGKFITIDKGTDRAALEPLHRQFDRWLHTT